MDGAEGLEKSQERWPGEVVAVICQGHCCPGTAVTVLEEPGGQRGFPVSPATAYLCPGEDKSVPGV